MSLSIGVAALATGALASAGPSVAAPTDRAASKTVVVTQDHLHRWAMSAFNDNADLTPNQKFVVGPATPPLGIGSLRFKVGSNDANRVEQFRTDRYDGRLLRHLQGLKYSTYQVARNDESRVIQPAFVRLTLDTDGQAGQDVRLFFYPANNQDQHPIEQGQWQRWDVANGTFNINGDPGDGTTTLDDFVTKYPNARIINTLAAPNPEGGGLTFSVSDQRNAKNYIDSLNIRFDTEKSTVVNGKKFDLEPN